MTDSDETSDEFPINAFKSPMRFLFNVEKIRLGDSRTIKVILHLGLYWYDKYLEFQFFHPSLHKQYNNPF